MGSAIRLRLHVSEPFDFERSNDSTDLFGTTRDHLDADADEWVIDLESWFKLHEHDYDSVLVSPRYVGERLNRIFDAFLGQPVRVAHRASDGWQYAMAGMLSLAPLSPGETGGLDNNDSRI